MNHRARGKKVSSFEDVIERNKAEGPEAGGRESKGGGRGANRREAEESSSDDGEEAPQKGAPAVRTNAAGLVIQNPNYVKRDEEKDGIELSRKQREEIEKQAARRRYEELHKAGKTDEAKADLARLEEVKKRREEAAKKRVQDEEEKRAKDAEQAKKGAMSAELKDALGGEAARMRGERSQNKKKEKEKEKEENKDADSYASAVATKPEAATEKKPVADGSINQCRAFEDDFM